MKSKRKLRLLIIIAFAISLIVILINSDFGVKRNKKINNGKELIFAHRGLSKYFIENSFKSFDACNTAGLNAIETDVSQTKDGHLIIFHSHNCKNLLGCDSNVADVNLSFFYNKFFVSRDTQSLKQKVPTLNQFIQKYGNKYFIYLDIKTVNLEVADSLIYLFEKYNLYESCIVADANLYFLFYIKLKEPKINTALEGFGAGKEWLYSIIPNRIMPDYFSDFVNEIDNDFVKFLNKKDIIDRYITYGVDTTNIHILNKWNVKNIIIDYVYKLGDKHNLREYSKSIKIERNEN